MTKKMHIHWDSEADHLEVFFQKSSSSYYEDLGDDIFQRKDEKTGKIIGYAFFNVQKRKKKSPLDIVVDIPQNIRSLVSS